VERFGLQKRVRDEIISPFTEEDSAEAGMDTASPGQETEETRQQVKLILIVEDDDAIGEVLVNAIQSETPYQVSLVADGFQALKMVQDIKPQLFLLDYQLPRMNGVELYDQLHALDGLEHVPTLMLSANAPTGELELRHVEYINKPFELEEVLQAILRLLE
jgi:CheY-like chemotaxis protein